MKRSLICAIVVFVLGPTSSALADPSAVRGAGVVSSPHDMTVWGYTDSQTRVCAFCHTPHHSSTTGGDYLPLWSRAEDAKQFNVAYQSSTINASELHEATSDKAIGPTRLCMSCHDGTIAPDQHYGTSAGAALLTEDSFPSIGKGSGVGYGTVGLTNDHPVGFDYAAVAAGPQTGDPALAAIQQARDQPTADPWIRNEAALFLGNTLGIAIADRLYLSNGKSYMTCATCHDVHNKKNLYTATSAEDLNYLVLAPQAGSALCLSCHIK